MQSFNQGYEVEITFLCVSSYWMDSSWACFTFKDEVSTVPFSGNSPWTSTKTVLTYITSCIFSIHCVFSCSFLLRFDIRNPSCRLDSWCTPSVRLSVYQAGRYPCVTTEIQAGHVTYKIPQWSFCPVLAFLYNPQRKKNTTHHLQRANNRRI